MQLVIDYCLFIWMWHNLTSGGSIALSTPSLIMKNAINNKNNPFTNPAKTSALAYPYENLSLGRHLEIKEAANPATRPVQSKNMWNESDMRPDDKQKCIFS